MSARLLTAHVDTGDREVVFESDSLHFEAPNWSPDGQWLVINADGRMFRLPVDGVTSESDLVEIDLGEVPGINNDHLISPDGRFFYVSGHDGHLYEVPWAASPPTATRPGASSTTCTASRRTAALSATSAVAWTTAGNG
jgi:TolB protein